MVVALIHKIAASGIAAAIAVGAALIDKQPFEPAAAYGAHADRLEADAVALHAARIFERSDFNNDGALDEEEFVILARVTAELARLNGFVAIERTGGVETIALARPAGELSEARKMSLQSLAARDFVVIAGADERLVQEEFVSAALEAFAATDLNRDGVLEGSELASFAAIQSKRAAIMS